MTLAVVPLSVEIADDRNNYNNSRYKVFHLSRDGTAVKMGHPVLWSLVRLWEKWKIIKFGWRRIFWIS
jgi:hypothetical protein